MTCLYCYILRKGKTAQERFERNWGAAREGSVRGWRRNIRRKREWPPSNIAVMNGVSKQSTRTDVTHSRMIDTRRNGLKRACKKTGSWGQVGNTRDGCGKRWSQQVLTLVLSEKEKTVNFVRAIDSFAHHSSTGAGGRRGPAAVAGHEAVSSTSEVLGCVQTLSARDTKFPFSHFYWLPAVKEEERP